MIRTDMSHVTTTDGSPIISMTHTIGSQVNVDSGAIYPSKEAALDAGEKPENIVEVLGTEEQVQRLSAKIREAKKAKRKQQKQSRKKNR